MNEKPKVVAVCVSPGGIPKFPVQEAEVRRDAVPGLEPDEVAGHELFGIDLEELAVPQG